MKPNIYCSIAAASLDIPVVATLTGLGSGFSKGFILNGILTYLYRLGLAKTNYTIFHNEEDQDLFHEKKITTNSHSLVVMGSGVDTIRYKAEPRKDHLKFRFLFVGRMIEEKGVREFAQAARRSKSILPNAEFLVIGPYEENDPRSVRKQELLEWVETGTIKYFGSQKDILPFLRSSDCLVLPSYREGMPRSVIEAMAVALPVIATDVPGCRSAIENEVNGLLVPVRNSTALSEAMVRMYNMPQEERMDMGRLNRVRAVSEFDVRHIVETYLELIKNVLGSSTRVDEKSRTRTGFFSIRRHVGMPGFIRRENGPYIRKGFTWLAKDLISRIYAFWTSGRVQALSMII